MKKQKRNREPAKQADPTGRLDWLVSQIVEKLASRNHYTRTAHQEFKGEIEAVIAHHLSPRKRSVREVKRAVTLAGKAFRVMTSKGVA